MHMTKTTIFYSKESYVVKLETAEESIVLMQSANGEYLKKEQSDRYLSLIKISNYYNTFE